MPNIPPLDRKLDVVKPTQPKSGFNSARAFSSSVGITDHKLDMADISGQLWIAQILKLAHWNGVFDNVRSET